MKKFFLMAVAAIFAFSCSAPAPTIEGTVDNLSGTVNLGIQPKKLAETIASVAVENGKFSFNHDGSFEGIMTLTVEGENSPFATFFVDKAATKIVVTGDKNSPKNIKIDGSATDAAYKAYLASKKTDEDMITFIKSNPNSIAAAYVLYRNVAPGKTADQLREYKALLNPALETSSYIQTLNDLIAKMDRVAVGQKFVDINLPDVDGKNVSLSSVVAENKYVLLDFWASWCPPCRVENPNVVAAFEKYNKKGFTVYGVSLDRPGAKDAWIKGIKDDKLNWTNVSDLQFWNCAPAAEYAVRSIPANFLIAQDGTIVAVNVKGEALHQKLEELLGK